MTTVKSWTWWSVRIGVLIGVTGVLATVGTSTVFLLDTRYALAEETANKAELPKMIQDAVVQAIHPIQTEQAVLQFKMDEIRCLLLGGKYVLGSCQYSSGDRVVPFMVPTPAPP